MRLSTSSAFKNRSREGLFEPTGAQSRALQQVELEIYKDIADFCDQNEIPFTLGGGSVLGAVRHKGFIPWDDDIDLNMRREDFNRFSVLFPLTHSDKYWLHVPGVTPSYAVEMARVRLKGTVVKDVEDHWTDECGAFVDIFIIENVPDGKVARAWHGAVSTALRLALSCKRYHVHRSWFLSLCSGDASLERSVKLKSALGALLSPISIDSLAHAANAWNAKYSSCRTAFATVPGGRAHYWGEMRVTQDFAPGKRVEFEGLGAPLPVGADAYLTTLYGPDYMTPPPPEQRERHLLLEFDLGEYGAESEQHGTAGKGCA